MSETEVFRIAVISDLHVDSNQSYIQTNMSESKYENPFSSLSELISKDELKADILICCGDMADQAKETAQRYAWSKIVEIAKQLEAEKYYGTVGNHDVDSRFASNEYDPKEAMQDLIPVFPGIDELYSNQYWARNFAFDEVDGIRLLNINSCAYHGYMKAEKDKNEYEYGRISQKTLDNIETELENQKMKKYQINIAFFHHHPERRTSRTDEDSSELVGGDRLIRLLSKRYGPWLIIHGHKHYPSIAKASGDENPPIIFSAGSFASTRLEKGKNNQFYIIEILRESRKKVQLPMAGSILSWNLSQGNVWNQAGLQDGIPYGCGFGNADHFETLADSIEAFVQDNELYAWNELVENFPKLKYTMPGTIENMLEVLKDEYGFTVFNQEDNGKRLLQIMRKKDE
jgi:Icc-related predicted phosphoesterase